MLAQCCNVALLQCCGGHPTSCIRIRTQGGIYGKLWPEPEGFPESAARGKSQGLKPYFNVYPNLSPHTDIIPFLTIISWSIDLLSINFLIFNFRRIKEDVRIGLPAGWKEGGGGGEMLHEK